MNIDDLKTFILSLIEEEFSPAPIEIAKKWQGGMLVLKPEGDTQAKEIPLEIFFKKIISLRESLRVLEQKLNQHPGLGQEDKVSMQSYITKCYGSLTSFNILFKEDKDKFVGAGKSGDDEKVTLHKKLTLGEAKKRLGLNEYGND